MRIVAGKFRGKQLTSPSDDSIRPTADRVRESMFNILASRLGPVFSGIRVLDLFAGTGALGLEAMSRGARFALFVDEGAEARACLRANIETFGLGGATKIFRRDATRLGPAGMAPFDLVFADPPYGKGLGERALASARDGGWLVPGALVVWEESAEAEAAAPTGFETLEVRTYGDAKVALLRAA